MKKIKKSLQNFFELEAATGILLVIATIFALAIANSEEYLLYNQFLSINIPLSIEFAGIFKDLSIRDWINDALMAIFFFLVGMELKKELMVGELSSRSRVMLPAIAGIGGILVPASIFFYFNADNPENMKGFAIAMATDIAFAYGMISMFGKKLSKSLKVFIVALAVFDDLIAILIIAFFYSGGVDFKYLFFAIFPILALFLLNKKNSTNIPLYLLVGTVLWVMILKSGIHATIAGVILGLFIPLRVRNKDLLENFAHKLAPIVNFFILPVFAFANAGVRIEGFSADLLLNPMTIGIIAGLFVGKQLGVMLFTFIAVKLKFANLPRGTDWLEFYAGAIFTGIGFTMSLFIGSLAFSNSPVIFDQVKIGVLAGSLLSVVYGFIISYVATRKYKGIG